MSVSGAVAEILMKDVYVSDLNVRKTDLMKDIDILAENISRYGLLQPVIVILKNGKYEIIVGQRRYLAIKQLGWEKIPAMIMGDLDEIQYTLISLSENVHRKELPYRDMVDACDILYDRYQDVGIIAREIGVSESTVQNYLAHRLVPEPIKKMVEEKKISRDEALRITTATFDSILEGNEEKTVALARQVVKMTKPEKNRAIEIVKKKPLQSIEKVVEEAKKPPKIFEIKIEFPGEIQERLGAASEAMDMKVNDVIKQAVIQWLKAMNY